MIINIFKTNVSHIFLAIPAGATVPEEFAPTGGENIQPFKRAVSVAGGPRIGLNSSRITREIDEQGWALIYARFAAF